MNYYLQCVKWCVLYLLRLAISCLSILFSCLAMSSSFPRFAVSASKARRLRATATKQKLYQAAQKVDPVMMMQTQITMLTASVDSLVAQLSMFFQHQRLAHSSCLDASAQPFVPAPPGFFTDSSPTRLCDAAAASESTIATNTVDVLDSWEALDPWLLWDKVDLCHVRATCKHDCLLVEEISPPADFA